jgi:hypothetical protein
MLEEIVRVVSPVAGVTLLADLAYDAQPRLRLWTWGEDEWLPLLRLPA